MVTHSKPFGTHARTETKRSAGRQRSFEDVFGAPCLSETFDREAALYLYQHADELRLSDPVPVHCWDDKFPKASPQTHLHNLLKQAPDGQNCLQVSYAKGAQDTDHTGRWYAQGKANLQRLPKQLRATLVRGHYLDLDFENCGPTLLLNLCEQHEVGMNSALGTAGFKWLRELVHNRESMLCEFGPCVTRDQAKHVVVQVMYGKTLNAIYSDMPDLRWDLEAVDWLPQLQREVAQAYKDLAACDEFAEIRARHKHAPNRDVKVVSTVLFELENACLEKLYVFLNEKGILPCGEGVLCFDGVMVPDTEKNRARIADGLLDEAAQYVAKHAQLSTALRIKNKPLGDGYALPDGYAQSVTESFFCIEAGDDQAAARIIIDSAGDRIIRSRDRLFCRDKESVIVREGEKAVREAIVNMTDHELVIMQYGAAGNSSHLHHYSKSIKLLGCVPRVLASPRIRDDGFDKRMWQKNLRFIAFTNGVWSFEEQRLLGVREALEKKIYFTVDTGRPFSGVCEEAAAAPATAAPETAMGALEARLAAAAAADPVAAELHRRVIEPFLPDASQRAFFFNCVARALAGEIRDKRWFVGLGPRNCGKGIFCKLMANAFGPLSRTMLAENLLNRGAPQDAAKAQSWLVDHEYTRIALSNEFSKAGRTVLDGEVVKRLCSNGDVIECRKNHQDEKQIRLQMTMFIFANDIPSMEPVDAFQTMLGFKFRSEFRDAAEFHDAQRQSAADPDAATAQKHWRVMDHSIDAFIEQPQVVDAFTRLVLMAYTPEILAPPLVVQEDTKSIKGAAAESQEQRFARIVQHTRDHRDVVFYQEIRRTAEDAGMGRLSDSKIDSFVRTLYGLMPMRPSKVVDGKSKQDRGFQGLRICFDGYDERMENLRRVEAVKQDVRSGVVTHDRYTADRSPFT